MHLLGVMGHPLPTPKPIANGFAMLNLIGNKAVEPKWDLPQQAWMHWYGKTENRPGRKMGHINSIDSTPEKALKKVLKLEKDQRL